MNSVVVQSKQHRLATTSPAVIVKLFDLDSTSSRSQDLGTGDCLMLRQNTFKCQGGIATGLDKQPYEYMYGIGASFGSRSVTSRPSGSDSFVS